jgi:hypothetical protein
MSVQSRRKPSKLFTATIYGFIWGVLLVLMICCVWGTLAEIRTQAVEGTERIYAAWYFLPLLIPAIIAVCRMGGAEASKRLYLTVQLVNFTVLLGVFRVVLDLAGENGLAFFLGNPVPGVISAYEAFFIWLLFLLGAILQMLSVMNDGYQSRIRSGVGGILFIIGIFLPNTLNSYALLRATCMGLQPNAQCEERVIEMIPVFTMAIAFSAALAVLFFFTMLSPAVARFISWLTGDGTNARESGSLSDSLEGAQNQQNLPGQELETAVLPSSAEPPASVAQRHSSRGSFAAAVLGGAVVWTIQAIGIRMTKHR